MTHKRALNRTLIDHHESGIDVKKVITFETYSLYVEGRNTPTYGVQFLDKLSSEELIEFMQELLKSSGGYKSKRLRDLEFQSCCRFVLTSAGEAKAKLSLIERRFK